MMPEQPLFSEGSKILPVAFSSIEQKLIAKSGKIHSEDAIDISLDHSIMTVGDGMRGPEEAHDASEEVVKLINQTLTTQAPPATIEDIVYNQEAAYNQVHQALLSSKYRDTGTAATTISLWAMGENKTGVITYAGDVTAYLIKGTIIRRLIDPIDDFTKDIQPDELSRAMDEVDAIETLEDAQKASSLAQQILEAKYNKMQPSHLGNYFGNEFLIIKSIIVNDLQPGDKIILASDGIFNLTTSEILQNSQTVEALTEAASERYQDPSKRTFRSTPDDIAVAIGVI